MYSPALRHLYQQLSGTNQTVAVTRPGRPYIWLAKLAKFPLREWNAGHGRFAFYCGTWAFPVINLHECDKVALLRIVPTCCVVEARHVPQPDGAGRYVRL
jgi:hypothetical protein